MMKHRRLQFQFRIIDIKDDVDYISLQ